MELSLKKLFDKKLFCFFNVFVIAAAIIFLEILLFNTLEFTSSYLVAMMCISFALLGMGIGAWLAYLATPRINSIMILLMQYLFLISIPVAVIAIMNYAGRILEGASFLIFPFVSGGFILSIFFTKSSIHRVYFYDLAGAASGAVLGALCIEWAGQELSFLFLFALLAFYIFMNHIVFLKRFQIAGALVCGICMILALLITKEHLGNNYFNFATQTKPIEMQKGWKKIYQILNVENPDRELLFSKASIVGRVDAVVSRRDDGSVWKCQVFTNGNMNDGFKFKKVEQYVLDPRVPHGFMKDPDTLIVGTSAEGIVNAVKGLGDGKIYGVEINPGKAAFMQTDDAKAFSYDAYQHIDELEITDVRSYLQRISARFDQITLMNAHLGGYFHRAPHPEYTHTVEGLLQYFDHLTTNGILNIEEVAYLNSMKHVYNMRFMATIVEALKRYGVDSPEKHIYGFSWSPYMQYLVKVTPFSREEIAWLDDWVERIRKNEEALPFKRIIPVVVWHPEKTMRGSIADIINSNIDAESPKYNLSPITDNKPFPFDLIRGENPVAPTLMQNVKIAFFFVFLPVMVLLMRLSVGKDKIASMFGMIIYFAILGLAYLLIEICLMQKYQMYLGSPAASLVTILGGMLLFSGLGSLISQRMPGLRLQHVVLVIMLLSLTLFLGFPLIMKISSNLPLWGRMCVALASISPLAFFMGMPFPIGIMAGKEILGEFSACLMFSVNAAFSAIAAPLSCLISMEYGFLFTTLIAVGLYGVSILTLSSMRRL